VARRRRAIRPSCARTAWKRNGWRSAVRAALASPAARWTWRRGYPPSVRRCRRGWRIVTRC
jgi:hypothetical protein